MNEFDETFTWHEERARNLWRQTMKWLKLTFCLRSQSQRRRPHKFFTRLCGFSIVFSFLLPSSLPHFLFTFSQFVFEVCTIKFSFLALTSEEFWLALYLVCTVCPCHPLPYSNYGYRINICLSSSSVSPLWGIYAVFLLFACITAVRAALKSIASEQGQTTVE